VTWRAIPWATLDVALDERRRSRGPVATALHAVPA
jgi:hypothetical protein